MAWDIETTNRFDKGYKRAASSGLRDRLDNVIAEIRSSEDPRKLGRFKTGQFRGCYSYEFGQSCRLIYSILFESQIINLIRVCDHKEYGP